MHSFCGARPAPWPGPILGDIKIEIQFPFQGLHQGLSAEKQPPMTTPHAKNVRAFDVEEERGRGGQRPGFVKAYTTQVGGAHPVLKIVTISTTYITPA